MAIQFEQTNIDTPFPYEIYVSNRVDRIQAVSWRLRMDPDEAPRAWVWVVGTGGNRQFLGNTVQVASCEMLGRLLAQNGFGLMTGGWEGVDEAMGKSFTKAFESNVRDIRRYQRIITSHGITLEPSLADNSSVDIQETRERALHKLVEDCHLCIMVGGLEGSMDAGEFCLRQGKVVFPIVETGGTAELFYTKHLTFADRLLDQYSGFDLETLKRSYKDSIDAIINYCQMKYPGEEYQQINPTSNV